MGSAPEPTHEGAGLTPPPEHVELRAAVRRWLAERGPGDEAGAEAIGVLDVLRGGDAAVAVVVAEELGRVAVREADAVTADALVGPDPLLRAAALVGTGLAAWAAAYEYASTREAFGRPVARFQVSRHRLARAATLLAAVRDLVADAAAAAERGAADANVRARVALRAAQAEVPGVVDGCLQLHGGYGYATASPVSALWQRAVAAATVPGAADDEDVLSLLVSAGAP